MMQILTTLQVFIYLLLFPLTLLSSGLRGNVDIPIAEITVSKGFDYAHCFVNNNNPYLFCYDSHTGKAALWNMFGGNTPIQSMTLGTNWSFFEFVHQEDGANLIALSCDGKMRLAKDVLNTSVSDIQSFDKGIPDKWSSSAIMHHDNSSNLLLYSKETGRILMNSLQLAGSLSLGTTSFVQVESGWDDLQLAENSDYYILLMHSTKTNRIVVHRIPKQGRMSVEKLFKNTTDQTELGELQSAANWTNANLVLYNQKVMLFLYCSSDGEVQILLQNGTEKSFTDIYKTKWSKGWSKFEVIYLNGVPHLFHYKESSGLARISKISIE